MVPPVALVVRALVLACQPVTAAWGGRNHRTESRRDHCPLPRWEPRGSREAGPLSLLRSGSHPKRMLGSTPEASSLLTPHSGGVVLLLLQADGRAAGRPSLLPGLCVAARRVHAGPEVTCHAGGCLSSLTAATVVVLHGGELALCSRKSWTLLGQAQATCVHSAKKDDCPLARESVPNTDSRTYVMSQVCPLSFLPPLPRGALWLYRWGTSH